MPGEGGEWKGVCSDLGRGHDGDGERSGEVGEGGGEGKMVGVPDRGWLFAITDVPWLRAREIPAATERTVRKSEVKSLSSTVTHIFRVL